MKVLFVCLGNICRSPLAEGILRQKAHAAGLDWEVDSAGTNGYHTGEAPHPLSQKVARQGGIDISRQRARPFTSADFQRFDKIYAMAGDVVDDIRRIAGRSGLQLSPLGSTSSVPIAVLGYPRYGHPTPSPHPTPTSPTHL